MQLALEKKIRLKIMNRSIYRKNHGLFHLLFCQKKKTMQIVTKFPHNITLSRELCEEKILRIFIHFYHETIKPRLKRNNWRYLIPKITDLSTRKANIKMAKTLLVMKISLLRNRKPNAFFIKEILNYWLRGSLAVIQI